MSRIIRLLHMKRVIDWLTAALILTIPLGREHIFKYSFNPYENVAIFVPDIIFIALLVAIALKNPKKWLNYRLFWILLIINVLLFTWSITKPPIFAYFKAAELISLTVVVYFVSRGREKLISISFAASGLIQVLIAVSQFLYQHSIKLHLLGEQVISPSIAGVAKVKIATGAIIRAYGTFFHPNQLGAFLIVACATALILLANKLATENKIYKPYVFLLFLVIAAEFLTFSRAGIITLCISLVLLLILVKNILPPKSFKITAATTAATLIITLVIFTPLLRFRAISNDNSYNEHIEFNHIGYTIFTEHPLGAGLGNVLNSEYYRNLEGWQRYEPPQNYFLLVADEAGVIGVLVILLFFGYVLYTFKGKWQQGSDFEKLFRMALLCIFVAFLFLMQFDHYFYTLEQTQLLLWFIIGLILGVNKNTATAV